MYQKVGVGVRAEGFCQAGCQIPDPGTIKSAQQANKAPRWVIRTANSVVTDVSRIPALLHVGLEVFGHNHGVWFTHIPEEAE